MFSRNNSFLLIIVCIFFSACSTYITKINDERIPESARKSLNEVSEESIAMVRYYFRKESSKDTIYTWAHFSYKKGRKTVAIRILRRLTFLNDTTWKRKYLFENYRGQLPGDLQSSGEILVAKSLDSVAVAKKVRYVCTHKETQHSTAKFEEIPTITKEYKCPSWNTVFDD